MPHLEYRNFDASDPNFPGVNDEHPGEYYRVLVEESKVEIIEKLKELREQIDAHNLRPWQFSDLHVIPFSQHLYQPLLHLVGDSIDISPVPLDKGERRFVEDLKQYYESSPALLESKELYLLRNLSKGRGVGFFEAGNFHPDVIVWLIYERQKYISFVGPKCIRKIGAQDPKIQFYKSVKEIEERLGDESVILISFIISNTPMQEMKMFWGASQREMESWNILFQKDEAFEYIEKNVNEIISCIVAYRAEKNDLKPLSEVWAIVHSHFFCMGAPCEL